MSSKILLLDIESSGMTAYAWGRWDQRISQQQVIQESYMLCYAAKWLDEKTMYSEGLIHFDGAVEAKDDRELCKSLWTLLDEADFVIGHYVKRFDLPEINRRFVVHGMKPPSPYKAICTKEMAKRYFRFSSNRLGDLGIQLGVGEKLSHEGFDMWRKCFEGDVGAWNKMLKYNAQDVKLLEKVYKRLLPYATNHPNLSTYAESSKEMCPKCGSHKLQSRGYVVSGMGRYRRLHCQSCGGWSRSRTNEMTKEAKGGITVSC